MILTYSTNSYCAPNTEAANQSVKKYPSTQGFSIDHGMVATKNEVAKPRDFSQPFRVGCWSERSKGSLLSCKTHYRKFLLETSLGSRWGGGGGRGGLEFYYP